MDEQIRPPVVEDTTGYSRFSEDKQRNTDREEDARFKLVPGVGNCTGLFLPTLALKGVPFFHTPAIASNWEKPRIRPPEQCFAKVSTSRSGKLVGSTEGTGFDPMVAEFPKNLLLHRPLLNAERLRHRDKHRST